MLCENHSPLKNYKMVVLMISANYWKTWNNLKNANFFKNFNRWYGGNTSPTVMCDSEEKDRDGIPIKQYSDPIIAVDKSGKPHISVEVTDYENEEPNRFFIDAYTGEELEIDRWKYIER